MLQIDFSTYLKISKKFENKPYNLTEAWIRFNQSKGKELLFFVDSLEHPKILCWSKKLKYRFIRKVLHLEGPLVKKGIKSKQIEEFLNGIKMLPFDGVYLNPNTPFDVNFEVGVRNAMFQRPIGQTSTSLTIVVNTKFLKFNRNWKRNLKKAEFENLSFRIKRHISFDECQVISRLHWENAKRRKLTEFLTSDEIHNLMKYDNIYSAFVYKNGDAVAARIIGIEENISYDIFACNSEKSREMGANQYLMQEIFKYLNDHNVMEFDFSRIPIGNFEMNGIYKFKLSSGGVVKKYNGQWWWFRKEYMRHLQYLRLLLDRVYFY